MRPAQARRSHSNSVSWVSSWAVSNLQPSAGLRSMPAPTPPTRNAGLNPAEADASLCSWPRFMPDRAAMSLAARAPAGVPATMPAIIPGAAAPGSLKHAPMKRDSSASYAAIASPLVSSGISAKNGNSAGATDACHWAIATAAPRAAAWGLDSSSAIAASPPSHFRCFTDNPPVHSSLCGQGGANHYSFSG